MDSFLKNLINIICAFVGFYLFYNGISILCNFNFIPSLYNNINHYDFFIKTPVAQYSRILAYVQTIFGFTLLTLKFRFIASLFLVPFIIQNIIFDILINNFFQLQIHVVLLFLIILILIKDRILRIVHLQFYNQNKIYKTENVYKWIIGFFICISSIQIVKVNLYLALFSILLGISIAYWAFLGDEKKEWQPL